MARILFAYEFGAGLGHLNILAAVAKRFVGRHRIAFAVPDLPLATAYLSRSVGAEIPVYPSPNWPKSAERIEERGLFCHTLAETLCLFAFDDPDRLDAACRAWSEIVDAEKPDVIVADSAPTARLALETRIPMVVVGTGYTVLPGGRALPPLRPWQPNVPPHSRAVEARIVALANDYRGRSRGRSVDCFSDLFRGDDTFVATLPEFDPYAAHRGLDPYTPFAIPDFSPGPPFASRRGHPIFAYLPGAHPAVLPVIEALNAFDAPSHLYLLDVYYDRVAKLCRRHVRVHTVPADFPRVLPECKVIIHHAGLGTTLAAMVAATAQVTLPALIENSVIASGLAAGGSSINVPVPPVPPKDDLISHLNRLLADGAFEARAFDRAERATQFREREPMNRIVEALNGYLP